MTATTKLPPTPADYEEEPTALQQVMDALEAVAS